MSPRTCVAFIEPRAVTAELSLFPLAGGGAGPAVHDQVQRGERRRLFSRGRRGDSQGKGQPGDTRWRGTASPVSRVSPRGREMGWAGASGCWAFRGWFPCGVLWWPCLCCSLTEISALKSIWFAFSRISPFPIPEGSVSLPGRVGNTWFIFA